MKGFTLIEILITIAIAGIIMLIVTGAFSSATGIKALEKDTGVVLSLLEQARNQTLSAKGALVYGVHFEADKAVLFSGASYSSSDPSNVIEPINPLVQISTIALAGGGSDVIFKRLTGETDQSGTVTFSIVAGQTKVITIFTTGVAQAS